MEYREVDGVLHIALVGKGAGYFALISVEDIAQVEAYNWRLHPHGYAVASVPRRGGPYRTVLMHRLVLDAQDGQEVDHINLEKLDNRRDNLRFCNRAENLHRRKKFRGASRFRGVYLTSSDHIWVAQIKINGVGKHLGRFKTEEAAALAYDQAARSAYGDFAYTNF